MFNADSNLTNSDWTKQSWDLGFTTLEQFFAFKGVADETPAKQRATIEAFSKLPAYESAPKSFKTEAQNFISATLKAITKFVPNKTDMELALTRLEILPATDGLVQIPWKPADLPQFSIEVWDSAVLEVVKLSELKATSPRLKVKKVRKHVEAMGQALKPYRTYALVVETQGSKIIIDGHHRLMASWLLGQESAPVWKVVI